jgi:hypothetical protein
MLYINANVVVGTNWYFLHHANECVPLKLMHFFLQIPTEFSFIDFLIYSFSEICKIDELVFLTSFCNIVINIIVNNIVNSAMFRLIFLHKSWREVKMNKSTTSNKQT